MRSSTVQLRFGVLSCRAIEIRLEVAGATLRGRSQATAMANRQPRPPRPAPTVPARRQRHVQASDELWSDFGAVALALGTNRAELIRQYMAWMARHTGTRAPRRPK